jgi:glutamyl-tRNA synthetase
MPSSPPTRIVGRLAPSPTGLLHLGHARSFLLAWWQVRAADGVLRMRMEDLDASRARPEFEAAALRDLEWLGLDWDGEVMRQSERHAAYDAAFEQLHSQGRLYSCVCTRAEIAQAVSAPHTEDSTRRYPGTCAGRFASEDEARALSSREPALRLRVEPGATLIADSLHGAAAFDVAAEVGDFPVRTRDGMPSYQLAVVVDDAAQGITDVLRGEDLLSSAARQQLLYTHLGLDPPRWHHVALVTDQSGVRLAKRTDALSLAALRESGVAPEVLVAWAAHSSGWNGPSRGTPLEFLETFDLATLECDPAPVSPGDFGI